MKAKRGASLTELLIMLQACVLILTLSAALLHRVMHAQSRASAFGNVERNSLRLARQFRHDVQQASSVKLKPEELGPGMILQLDLGNERVVEYFRFGDTIQRVLQAGKSTAAREEFVFTPEMQLFVREELSPKRITLSLESLPPRGEATEEAHPRVPLHETPLALQVSAVLGRFSTYAPPTANSEDHP